MKNYKLNQCKISLSLVKCRKKKVIRGLKLKIEQQDKLPRKSLGIEAITHATYGNWFQYVLKPISEVQKTSCVVWKDKKSYRTATKGNIYKKYFYIFG